MVTSTEEDDTDPYCPPVGTTPLDDAPFVIEGSDELPAGDSGISIVIPTCVTAQTYINTPFTVCQSFTNVTLKRDMFIRLQDPETNSKL